MDHQRDGLNLMSAQQLLLAEAAAAAGAGDPLYSKVVFLTDGQGTNGATTIIDQSSYHHSLSSSAGSALDNTDAEYGGTALKGHNTTPWSAADSPAWNISPTNSSKVCIEYSLYQSDRASTYDVFSQLPGSGQYAWLSRHNGADWIFYWSSDGSSFQTLTASGGVGPAGAFSKYCIEKNAAGKWRMYRDGVMKANSTPADSSIHNSTGAMNFNGSGAGQDSWFTNARITLDTRYDNDAGYTPATAAFPTFGPPAGDPYWANVTFMVSGIGANGATAMPDLSTVNCGSPAITGGPTISTSSPITGFSSSILTSGAAGGSSDYLKWGNGTIPPSLDTPTTLNAVWTIEMVWKPSAAGTVFAWGGDWGGVGTYGGFVQNISGGSFRCYNGVPAGVNGFDFSSAASQWSSGTEYFLVLESNGTKIRLYLGTLASGTFTMIASTSTVTGGDARDLVGGRFHLSHYGFAGQSAGRWNWIRVTKGIARFNSDSGGTIPAFPLPTHA
jgi:hypothetical protein